MTPRVSVVIVFFNGENFIREAINSVFAQTFTEWELVLVDDGSRDSSSGIAREVAEANPQVRYFCHPGKENRGVVQARILGSDAAAGEYLAFLDHDDILYPDALARMVRLLDTYRDVAAVFAGTHFWAFDPTISEADAISSYRALGSGPINGRRVLRDLIRSDDHHPANCSTLFRRAEYLAAREMTDPYPGMYEETALLFTLLTRGDVYILDEPVSAYRMHAASMCQRAKAKGTLSDRGYSADRAWFLRWAARHLPMDRWSRVELARVLLRYRIEEWVRRS